VHAQRAWFQRARGQDPSANVRAAVESLKRALERNPRHPTFWADLGMAYSILAAYELEHDRDPQPSLAQASAAIDNALDNNPQDPQSQLYLGETRGILARFRARQGLGKAEDFEQAAQAFQKAIELAPENQEYPIAFGHFCRGWAIFQRDTEHGTGGPLARGLELVNQVLATHPTWPDARILRASLLLLQAQSSGSDAERREQAKRASEDFSKALAINPVLDKAWRSQAALAQQLASAPR
jgi:serine/threonine-protein kinase